MERGAITAEIAVALPSLVLVLAVALGALEAAATHIACVDAARLGARALARGDTAEAAQQIALRSAPDEARAEVETDSPYARVTVSAPVRLGGVGGSLVVVKGRAATPLESDS